MLVPLSIKFIFRNCVKNIFSVDFNENETIAFETHKLWYFTNYGHNETEIYFGHIRIELTKFGTEFKLRLDNHTIPADSKCFSYEPIKHGKYGPNDKVCICRSVSESFDV